MQRRFFDFGDTLSISLTGVIGRIFPIAFIACFISVQLHAQSIDPPPSIKIYNDIKAQEPNFPAPKEVSTITVGSLDLSYNKSGDIPRKYPSFDFAIEKYTNGTTYKLFKQITPSKDFPDYTSYTLDVPNEGGTISIANIAKMNFRIALKYWDQYPASATATITLGDQTKTVKKGTAEVIFENITEGAQAFSITINGYEPAKGSPEVFQMKGLLPFYIKWQTIGAGIVTVPVLPVSLTYAPFVDKQQLNVSNPSGISTTTTSIAFTNADGSARALPIAFRNQADMQKKIDHMIYIMGQDSAPATLNMNTALIKVSRSLRAYPAQNTIAQVTPQNMLVLTNPATPAQPIPASKGGPGEADVISYYYNARILWYFENGVMSVTMLGADGFNQASASDLKTAYSKLKNQPPDFGNQQLHLNANAINSLLQLDPMVQGGPGLNNSRFIDIGQANIQVNGDSLKRTFNYNISNFNVNSTARLSTAISMDSPNFPAFLGLDLPAGQAMQAQVSNGASVPNGINQQQSQTLIFNAGEKEAYSCRVYYDVVFGTVVCKDVTQQNTVEISGTYYDAKRDAAPGVIVNLKAVNNVYSTTTDAKGRFRFSVPTAEVVLYDLYANNALMKITFRGKPLRHLKLGK